MTINVNCSYDALHGLIERSNTNERLEISDEWLRANEVLSIAQYQKLREKWNRQTERYGTWEVTIESGSVKYKIASGLTYRQALRMCKDAHWKWNHNNGLMWDMCIDWEG